MKIVTMNTISVVSSGPTTGERIDRTTTSVESSGSTTSTRTGRCCSLVRARRRGRGLQVRGWRRRRRCRGRRPADAERGADRGHPRREQRLQAFDLLLDRAGVAWRVGRKARRLAANQRPDEAEEPQRQDDADDHCGHSPQAGSTEEVHERREDERQDHRKDHRDEDVLGGPQRGDHDRRDQRSAADCGFRAARRRPAIRQAATRGALRRFLLHRVNASRTSPCPGHLARRGLAETAAGTPERGYAPRPRAQADRAGGYFFNRPAQDPRPRTARGDLRIGEA